MMSFALSNLFGLNGIENRSTIFHFLSYYHALCALYRTYDHETIRVLPVVPTSRTEQNSLFSLKKMCCSNECNDFMEIHDLLRTGVIHRPSSSIRDRSILKER